MSYTPPSRVFNRPKNGKRTDGLRLSIHPIDSIRHGERRTGIPTEKQRGFLAADEVAPSSLLHTREISLDPQLVWQGKDEQDRAGLEVPVVPVVHMNPDLMTGDELLKVFEV